MGNTLYTEQEIQNAEHDSTTAAKNVSLVSSLNKKDDAVTAYPKGGTPVNLSASGQILSAPGQILGFYVNSTDGGTIRIADYISSGSGYLGAAITPATGWHKFPSVLSVGGYVTISGTIDVTFFVLSE